MRIRIEGGKVRLEDELGGTISMTTDELFEMIRLLNVSMNEDGGLIFEVLEFTV